MGGSPTSVNNKAIAAQRALRGRIHVQNDVLNGVSGLEQLTNVLKDKSPAM